MGSGVVGGRLERIKGCWGKIALTKVDLGRLGVGMMERGMVCW
ncbi:hypothetical protein [Staphylococcus epidermidis]|nr:hypothetical protein [Staphylococcus epidermidis]